MKRLFHRNNGGRCNFVVNFTIDGIEIFRSILSKYFKHFYGKKNRTFEKARHGLLETECSFGETHMNILCGVSLMELLVLVERDVLLVKADDWRFFLAELARDVWMRAFGFVCCTFVAFAALEIDLRPLFFARD